MLSSIRPVPVSKKKKKKKKLGRPFQFSVNGVFRIKAEHFSFKMKVLARYSLRNSCRRNSSHPCNVGKIGVFNTSFRFMRQL